MDYKRERFEELVYAQYFVSQIEKTGLGMCLEFMPKKDTVTKSQFIVRKGEDYENRDITAMWWGWKKAFEELR